MKTVAIVGAGVVGTALGSLLKKKSYRIVGVSSRSLSSSRQASKTIGPGTPVFLNPEEATQRAQIVLITTPDRVIKQVCDRIAKAKGFRKGSLVLHASGFYSSRILDSARRQGAYVGSLHPLQSFASPDVAMRWIPGSVFGWEASRGAQGKLLKIIRDLKGIPIEVSPSSKALYHAAAVFVSNYTATLFQTGVELLNRARQDRSTTKSSEALLPLLLGTSSNLAKLGLPRALTGPVSRGDLPVIEGHLRAFRKRGRSYLPLYLLLARRTIPIGISKKSLSRSDAAKLRRILRVR